MPAFVYILNCADGSYYVGSTTRLRERFEEHASGNGAVHTARRLPVELAFYEQCTDIKSARIREQEIKGWSRTKKETLIKSAKWAHAFAVGVYAIITNEQNEICLVHHIDKDQWMLPGGGIEPNEELITALQRTVLEEAGIATEQERFILINQVPREQQIICVFTAVMRSSDPFKRSHQIDKRQFFSPNSLPDNTTQSSRLLIKPYVEKNYRRACINLIITGKLALKS